MTHDWELHLDLPSYSCAIMIRSQIISVKHKDGWIGKCVDWPHEYSIKLVALTKYFINLKPRLFLSVWLFCGFLPLMWSFYKLTPEVWKT